jgi:hypothetical protein
VRYLEEESRRKDHLLAAALERIPPALEEAPREPRESPETASEATSKSDVYPTRSSSPGGVSCSEDRRNAMTEEYGNFELREKIIAIICEEWPNSDNELEATAKSERLQSQGVETSEQAVRVVLLQLADHKYIGLALPASHHPTTDMTIPIVSRQKLRE